MKVELKKISFYEKLSEETYCFTANLYINGKKGGTVENLGHGGPTDYHLDDKELQKQFEHYASSLPPRVIPKGTYGNDEDVVLTSNAEHLVDDLFETWVKKYYEKKELKLRQINERKFKKEFASLGLLTIRLETPDSCLWIAYHPSLDINERVNNFKKKYKKNVIKWELLK